MIPGEEINVGNDLAYCRPCNLAHRLSEITLAADELVAFRSDQPPSGVSVETAGARTVITASNRSIGSALGLLFFAVFWNGITSVFVVLAFAATLHNLNLPMPGWFPAPRMNGGTMGWGETLFLWLFLTPFILIGVGMASAVLNCLFGRTEVVLEGTQSSVFSGVGRVGWRRRFEAPQITEIRLYQKRNSEGADTHGILLALRSGKEIKFGTMLTKERRSFMLQALRQRLNR